MQAKHDRVLHNKWQQNPQKKSHPCWKWKQSDWQKCSEADKQKINTMFPGAYEFKKIEAKKPPKPTPNMLEGEPNQK